MTKRIPEKDMPRFVSTKKDIKVRKGKPQEKAKQRFAKQFRGRV